MRRCARGTSRRGRIIMIQLVVNTAANPVPAGASCCAFGWLCVPLRFRAPPPCSPSAGRVLYRRMPPTATSLGPLAHPLAHLPHMLRPRDVSRETSRGLRGRNRGAWQVERAPRNQEGMSVVTRCGASAKPRRSRRPPQRHPADPRPRRRCGPVARPGGSRTRRSPRPRRSAPRW